MLVAENATFTSRMSICHCRSVEREKTTLFANICEQDQHKNVEKELILGFLGSPVVMVIRLLTEV